jgi:hypothetical protein
LDVSSAAEQDPIQAEKYRFKLVIWQAKRDQKRGGSGSRERLNRRFRHPLVHRNGRSLLAMDSDADQGRGQGDLLGYRLPTEQEEGAALLQATP